MLVPVVEEEAGDGVARLLEGGAAGAWERDGRRRQREASQGRGAYVPGAACLVLPHDGAAGNARPTLRAGADEYGKLLLLGQVVTVDVGVGALLLVCLVAIVFPYDYAPED